MDLGRFLAQLDLVVTKDCGQSAEPVRHQLADSFVAGYTDSAGVPVTDESFLDRIDLFRSLSLASTALHACRQLKERRLSLALSLLIRHCYRPPPDRKGLLMKTWFDTETVIAPLDTFATLPDWLAAGMNGERVLASLQRHVPELAEGAAPARCRAGRNACGRRARSGSPAIS